MNDNVGAIRIAGGGNLIIERSWINENSSMCKAVEGEACSQEEEDGGPATFRNRCTAGAAVILFTNGADFTLKYSRINKNVAMCEGKQCGSGEIVSVQMLWRGKRCQEPFFGLVFLVLPVSTSLRRMVIDHDPSGATKAGKKQKTSQEQDHARPHRTEALHLTVRSGTPG